MDKLDSSDTQKYEKVDTEEEIKQNGLKEEPATYGYGVRHIQVLLIFVSLTFAYITRAHINVTIVAMTDAPTNPILSEPNHLKNNGHENSNKNFTESRLELLCVNETVMYVNENGTNVEGLVNSNVSCSDINLSIEAVDVNKSIEYDEDSRSIWNVLRIYPWPKATQEMVLGSFFLGYLIMTTPMGMVCQRWGGKIPLQISLFSSGIITLVTPWLAAVGGYKAVCLSRVAIGLAQAGTYPSIHLLIAKWVPASERGRLGTYVYTGSMLGSLSAFYISGFLSVSVLGWPSVFWVAGTLTLVVAVLITLFIAPTPQQHISITEAENKFILGELHGQAVKRRATPWKEILTSKHVWAALITHFGNATLYIFFFTQMPTYLHYIIGVDIKNSGVLSSLPYLANFFTSIVLGNLADYFINKDIISCRNVRIISNTIASVIPAACLFGVSYTANPVLAVFCLVLCMGALAGTHTGWMVNYIDLSPNFSGALMATGNTLMNVGAVILPTMMSFIVTDVHWCVLAISAASDFPDAFAFIFGIMITYHQKDVHQWRIMFFLVATISVVTNAVFMIFMSADAQPWNEATCEPIELQDLEEKEKEENKLQR